MQRLCRGWRTAACAGAGQQAALPLQQPAQRWRVEEEHCCGAAARAAQQRPVQELRSAGHVTWTSVTITQSLSLLMRTPGVVIMHRACHASCAHPPVHQMKIPCAGEGTERTCSALGRSRAAQRVRQDRDGGPRACRPAGCGRQGLHKLRFLLPGGANIERRDGDVALRMLDACLRSTPCEDYRPPNFTSEAQSN